MIAQAAHGSHAWTKKAAVTVHAEGYQGRNLTDLLLRITTMHAMQKELERKRKIEKSQEDARMEQIQALVEEARQRGGFQKPVGPTT